MTGADAPAVQELMQASFADLAERFGRYEPPAPPDSSVGWIRIRHLIGTDPGGAWVADDGGKVVGAALGIVREGIWGLSLLVVHPARQSEGLGRELLGRALAIAQGTRGGLILGSEDARALRAYARAGFDARPALDARGPIRHPPERPAAVRDLRWPDDEELVDRVSRRVRGATHSLDVPALIASGRRMLAHESGEGFASRDGGKLALLLATSDRVATELLQAHLHDAGAGTGVEVDFITAGNDWAIRVLLDAGVNLTSGGVLWTRGETGPLRPYVPSGAYL